MLILQSSPLNVILTSYAYQMTTPLNALSAPPPPTCARPCTNLSGWHEWGEEAFATAKRDNKPILLRYRCRLVSLVSM